MNTRPNVLLIMTDQLRYDCVGYAALRGVRTPHLDELSERSVRFEQAYTAIPTCCPARQSFLRTKRPESFGAYWNYDITFPVATLAPGEYTWSRALQGAGYRSAYIGKWHVSPDHSPLEYGYDSYYGVDDCGRHFESIAPDAAFENGWRGGPDKVPVEESRTHILARQACDAIETLSVGGAPWHVRLDFPEPHLPCRPAGRFAKMYDPAVIAPWDSFGDTLEGKPFIQRQQLRTWGVESYSWNDWAPIVARYFGVISQIDDAVGRVLDALKRSGELDNTIVVFSSDHGDLCGAHRMVDKHYVMYDDVVRVPLLLSWPTKFASPRTVRDFVSSTLDVGLTILELAGVELPSDTHGRSLVARLDGSALAPGANEIVASYNGAQFGLYCQRMIRTDRWKYVWNLTDVDELYDMDRDPHELINLNDSEELASVRARLRERLHAVLAESGDPLVQGPWLTSQLLDHNPLETLEMP